MDVPEVKTDAEFRNVLLGLADCMHGIGQVLAASGLTTRDRVASIFGQIAAAAEEQDGYVGNRSWMARQMQEIFSAPHVGPTHIPQRDQ